MTVPVTRRDENVGSWGVALGWTGSGLKVVSGSLRTFSKERLKTCTGPLSTMSVCIKFWISANFA